MRAVPAGRFADHACGIRSAIVCLMAVARSTTYTSRPAAAGEQDCDYVGANLDLQRVRYRRPLAAQGFAAAVDRRHWSRRLRPTRQPLVGPDSRGRSIGRGIACSTSCGQMTKRSSRYGQRRFRSCHRAELFGRIVRVHRRGPRLARGHTGKAGRDMSSQPWAAGSLRWVGVSHRTLMAWRLLSLNPWTGVGVVFG
jgi:hypothetical protein